MNPESRYLFWWVGFVLWNCTNDLHWDEDESWVDGVGVGGRLGACFGWRGSAAANRLDTESLCVQISQQLIKEVSEKGKERAG